MNVRLNRNLIRLFGLIMVLALVLSACAPTAPPLPKNPRPGMRLPRPPKPPPKKRLPLAKDRCCASATASAPTTSTRWP
ncbi:MAG: hypothetical protein R2873_23400 [Caldilineaceae bacterium]